MARPGEDDRDAVNRAFAELVAGYHLTSDRPDPLVDQRGTTTTAPSGVRTAEDLESDWTTIHPLFRLLDTEHDESDPPRELLDRPYWPAATALPAPAPEPERVPVQADDDTESYVPDPLPPLTRPGVPALVGWIGIGYAALLMVAGAFGLPVPTWAGWLAVGGFLGGFGILLTQLPHHRPPDAGDGAVL
ncbi:MAG: hypothetical protein JWP61_644 [Friedmanniella sp.]|nr:hypothetical protein [Friedmanniella sp.]